MFALLEIARIYKTLKRSADLQGPICPPPGMTCGRFLINTVQSLDRHTKSAILFDMYSQQFTVCYFPRQKPSSSPDY